MKIRLLVEKQLNEDQQNKKVLSNSLYSSMLNGAFVDFVFLKPLEVCYNAPGLDDPVHCREVTLLPVHKAKVVRRGRQLLFAVGHEIAEGFLPSNRHVEKKWFLDLIAEQQEKVDFIESTVSFRGVTYSFEDLRLKTYTPTFAPTPLKLPTPPSKLAADIRGRPCKRDADCSTKEWSGKVTEPEFDDEGRPKTPQPPGEWKTVQNLYCVKGKCAKKEFGYPKGTIALPALKFCPAGFKRLRLPGAVQAALCVPEKGVWPVDPAAPEPETVGVKEACPAGYESGGVLIAAVPMKKICKKVDITKVKLDDEIVLGSGIKWEHMIKRAADYGHGLEDISIEDRTNIVELVTQLKVIKDNSGGDLTITPAGGWRTKKQNLDRRNPAKKSRHLRGKAADIVLSSSFLWANYKDLFQKMSGKEDLPPDILDWFAEFGAPDPIITERRTIMSLIQSFHIIKLMSEGKIKSGRVLIYVVDSSHTHYDIAKGPYVGSAKGDADQVDFLWLYYMMKKSPRHSSATLKSWAANSAILKW